MDIQPPSGPKPEDQNQPGPMPPQPGSPIVPPATPEVSQNQTPTPTPVSEPIQSPTQPSPTPVMSVQTQSPSPAPQQPVTPSMPPMQGDNSLAPENNPGKGLGIASLILAFIPFMGLISLILGIIGKKKSSNVGQKNGLALAGIILGVLNLIAAIGISVMLAFGATQLVEKCEELGPGIHVEDGITYTCESQF